MGGFNFPITNLTQAAAQQYLQNDGLETLGLTTVALSPHWSTMAMNGANAYDGVNLTLTIPQGNLLAPFRGILTGAFPPAASQLIAAVNGSATTLSIVAGDFPNFPAPVNPDGVILEISKPNGSAREFVRCSGVTAPNTLTVSRGWNGSEKQDWAPGDRVVLRRTRSRQAGQFYDASGAPINTSCAVFRFHPQAALRLERLMIDRLTPNMPNVLPVPVAMVIHGAQFLKTDQFHDAQDPLPFGGVLTFHDARGLIIDPAYVASVFDALLQWMPGLQPTGVLGTTGDANGITAMSNYGNGVCIHVVDMHGDNFQPYQGMLLRQDNNGVQPVSSSLPFLLPANNVLKGTDYTRLRWGWMGNGILATPDLAPPALAVNLPRQFYRMCVVDLRWALVGNRSPQTVLGIQAADQRIPEAQFLPQVRDQVTIDYLADGPDSLAEATRVLNPPGNVQFRLAVSAVLDTNLDTPTAPGAAAHWPQYPAPPMNNPGGFPAAYPLNLTNSNVSAQWAPNGKDVVVTLTGSAMLGDHIRVYPQVFVTISAIAADPSFVRGDGGSTIATANQVSLLLIDPFRVGPGQVPNPPDLVLDVVVAPAAGGPRRMWGAVPVRVQGSAGALPPNAFPQTGNPPLMNVPQEFRGISAYPLFGVPVSTQPVPLPPNPTVVDRAMSLGAEPQPRQAARLPTMARFETMVASGVGPSSDAALTWDAVVTGGRWGAETRSAQHANGNPGNPAGPDLHAPGVRVTGGLAYDVAYAAIRRAQPMIPWPSAATSWNFGWTIYTAG
ncbi:MAG TPA: hypothetical protein VES20_21190, partial [Bryobacteraceae bacterium]|nr:hypothetical protein [Bryobacteraceae bacterium]